MRKAVSNRQKYAKEELSAERLAPSQYMALTTMSTKDRSLRASETTHPGTMRLLNMAEVSHYKDTIIDLDEPLFQPSPSEVIFQKFEPRQTYEIHLLLRNNDKVARHVKVIQEDSPYFNVVSPKSLGSKVAPGMEITYIVQFNQMRKGITPMS
eukprot:m.73261 g.73261  ORF g.73261 m.73261 type:complete len:153 (+) comp35835_c0_seq1:61-519(+)